MSITVPAHVELDTGPTSLARVPGGYGLLMTVVSSQCKETKRLPLYLIVGYTDKGR